MNARSRLSVYLSNDTISLLRNKALVEKRKVNDIIEDAILSYLHVSDGAKCINVLIHLALQSSIKAPAQQANGVPRDIPSIGDFPAQIAIDIPQRSGAEIIAGY